MLARLTAYMYNNIGLTLKILKKQKEKQLKIARFENPTVV